MYSFWARCARDCGRGPQGRFKEALDQYFEAVNTEARARDEGVILDLESYIDIRRDTSGKLANPVAEYFVLYFFE